MACIHDRPRTVIRIKRKLSIAFEEPLWLLALRMFLRDVFVFSVAILPPYDGTLIAAGEDKAACSVATTLRALADCRGHTLHRA
jgi:hypothetical protein